MAAPIVELFGVGLREIVVLGVKKIVVKRDMVGLRVGEKGVALKGERKVVKGDEMSEFFGGDEWGT